MVMVAAAAGRRVEFTSLGAAHWLHVIGGEDSHAAVQLAKHPAWSGVHTIIIIVIYISQLTRTLSRAMLVMFT